MASIFRDGAEMGDVLLFNSPTAGLTAVTSNPSPRSGVYCYNFNDSSDNGQLTLPTAKSEIYLRYGMHFGVVVGAGSYAGVPLIRTGATAVASIRIEVATGRVQAYVSSTLVGTSTTALQINTWYLIEVYFKEADSGGRFVVKIDGNIEIDFTGDTKPSTGTTFDNFLFTGGQSGSKLSLDDLGCNDTSGAEHNSWLGDGRIVSLTPNANGANSNWFASSGTNHYFLVDEVPKDDDATYVWLSGTIVGVYDNYNVEDYQLSGTAINFVWPEVRAKKTVAEDVFLDIGIYTPEEGGQLFMNSGTTLTTSYARYAGRPRSLSPFGEAWNETNIDDAQLVLGLDTAI